MSALESKNSHVLVYITHDQLERMDALGSRLSEPWRTVTRSDLVRYLTELGLDEAEANTTGPSSVVREQLGIPLNPNEMSSATTETPLHRSRVPVRFSAEQLERIDALRARIAPPSGPTPRSEIVAVLVGLGLHTFDSPEEPESVEDEPGAPNAHREAREIAADPEHPRPPAARVG